MPICLEESTQAMQSYVGDVVDMMYKETCSGEKNAVATAKDCKSSSVEFKHAVLPLATNLDYLGRFSTYCQRYRMSFPSPRVYG